MSKEQEPNSFDVTPNRKAHIELVRRLGGAGWEIIDEPSEYVLDLFRRHDEGDPSLVVMTLDELKASFGVEDET